MKMKMKKICALALLLCLSASAAFAAGAMTKDTLIVGTESTFPPYEFRSSEGKLIGYDIDTIEAIGAKLGKKIEWVDMAFDSLIPSLLTNKIDVIAAGMSATTERKKRISFTITPNPTVFDSAFFVPAGKEKHSVEELEGLTIAAQLGSIQDIFIKKMNNVTVKNFQKTDDCMREVLYGRIDAALISGGTGYEYMQAKDFAGKIGICVKVKAGTGAEGQAFGVSKNDPELVAAMDKVIEEMKASGEIQALRDKWGIDDWLKAIKD